MEGRVNIGAPLCGSMTALVTPFRSGEVDWAALDRLVDRQIEAGTDWLVPLGTTGESPTLTETERGRVLDAVIARASGRCPVMAGTGSNNTAKAVEWTRRAASAGAAAALVVAPYYNRPMPEGMFRHYATIAEAVDFPLVLYNVPARTGIDLPIDVVVRLRQRYANIVAIKDATGRVENVTELRMRCDMAVLCGDDALTWPFMALGAAGVISVLANLVPKLMKSLVTEGQRRDVETARQTHQRIYDLATGIGRFGPNPLPIKSAMARVGLIAEEFRLPLCPLDDASRHGIVQVLRRHELLEAADR